MSSDVLSLLPVRVDPVKPGPCTWPHRKTCSPPMQAPFPNPVMARTRRLSCLFFVLCFAGIAPHAALAATGGSPPHYTVESGDTLSGIARKHKVSVKQLRRLNRLDQDRIHPGQKLRLRSGGNPKGAKKAAKKSRKRRKKPWTGGCGYTVKKGDYLGKIARKRRTTVRELRRLNGKKKTKRLRPGDHLRVCHLEPGGGRHKLKGGVQLPAEGDGYIGPRRNRVWGRAHAVEAITRACASLARKFPGTAPVYIGDMSFKAGGYMPPHKSHRTGLDADIGYFFKGNTAKDWFATPPNSEFDAEKTLALLEELLATGLVHQFYVDYRLQRRLHRVARKRGYKKKTLARMFEFPDKRGTGRTKTIRHLKGHDHHFHVRFVSSPPTPTAATPRPDEQGPEFPEPQKPRESPSNPDPVPPPESQPASPGG